MSTETPPAVTREPPPPLEHPLPLCSICQEIVEYDAGFYCRPCGASWDSKGSHLNGHSHWDDAALEQCPATIRPWAGSTWYPSLAKATFRCLRSAGHDGMHHGFDDVDGHAWTDQELDGYRTADLT